jgi:Mg-chelatase subunit ChlD
MTRSVVRRTVWPLAAVAVWLAACAGFDAPAAQASPRAPWPPLWQAQPVADLDGAPAFTAPNAEHCRRAPTTREVPGGGRTGNDRFDERRRSRGEHAERSESARESEMPEVAPRKSASALAASPAAMADAAGGRAMPSPPPQPSPHQRPTHERVTAAVVDDNADFGEYLAYRQRKAGLPVHDRDVSERYLLEVTDSAGQPVADAEVAVQRPGVAAPVMWARTDTAGRVWLQPRVFLAADVLNEQALGVAVRKAGGTGRAMLVRGQKQSVQVRLGGHVDARSVVARTRLDLVFLVDATGSMGDEIAKLKHSMRAMAEQIAQLPGQPDICWGLVAYRDHGDAFLTRTHNFTNDLAAFQQMLAKVQAGGGGDTPEALDEALVETVHGLDWRADATRLVVLVADAPPHTDRCGAQDDAAPSTCPRYDREMQAALAKGIKVFAVGASGLDPVGEYVFRQIAQYTAGRFVFLTYRDAANPGSGPGTQTAHDVKQYSVQTLDALVVRLVGEELARLPKV